MRKVDTRLFRYVCGNFASGVTVVTTRDTAGDVRGMTASAFMFVSVEPRLVVVSVSERARLRATLDDATEFAVSFLAEDQQDVSDFFAGRSEALDAAPFVEIDAGAPPVIEGAPAWMRCRLAAAHRAGDHVLYVGEAMEVWAAEDCARRPPLVFFRGAYVPIVPQEGTAVDGRPGHLAVAGPLA